MHPGMGPSPNPRRWAVCAAIAAALFLAAPFAIPASWVARFFSPLSVWQRRTEAAAPQPLEIVELEIVAAKPAVTSEPFDPTDHRRRRPRPELRDDDYWWRTVWRARLRADSEAAVGGTARRDSAARRLALLGGLSDLLRRVEPDSAMAARLARLFLQERFDLGELKPFLAARGYALDHADLQSREADMFDEHLRRSVPVTDGPDAKLRREGG